MPTLLASRDGAGYMGKRIRDFFDSLHLHTIHVSGRGFDGKAMDTDKNDTGLTTAKKSTKTPHFREDTHRWISFHQRAHCVQLGMGFLGLLLFSMILFSFLVSVSILSAVAPSVPASIGGRMDE